VGGERAAEGTGAHTIREAVADWADAESDALLRGEVTLEVARTTGGWVAIAATSDLAADIYDRPS
jgi:hypothetical protein